MSTRQHRFQLVMVMALLFSMIGGVVPANAAQQPVASPEPVAVPEESLVAETDEPLVQTEERTEAPGDETPAPAEESVEAPIETEEPVIEEQPEDVTQPEGPELVEPEPAEQDEQQDAPEDIQVDAAPNLTQTQEVRPRAVVGPGVTSVTVTPTVLENVCDPVRMDVTWEVADGAKAGDTFTFTLDSRLNVTNTVVNLSAPDGSVVGSLRLIDGVATVTLTDYVETHSNVRGTAWFESSKCWAEVFEGTTVDLEFSGSETFTIPVTVPVAPTPVPTEPPPPPVPGTNPEKSGKFTREDQGRENQENAIEWTITAPSGPSGGVTITDNAGDNWIFECDTIAWLNGIEPVDYDCSENGVTAEFGPYTDQWYPRPGFTIEATITGDMPANPEELLTFRNTAHAEAKDPDGTPLTPGEASTEISQTPPPEPTPTPDPNVTPTPEPTPTPGTNPEKRGDFTDPLDQGKTELKNAIRWTVKAPSGPAGGITITDEAGPNWVFECDTFTYKNDLEPVSVDCTPELLVVEYGPYASAENPWWPLPEFTIEASVTTPISTQDKTFTNTVITVVNGWEGNGTFYEGSMTSSLQQSSSAGGGGIGDNVRVPATPTVSGNVCEGSEYIPPTVVVDDLDSGLTYDIGEVDPETGAYTVTATLAPEQMWGDLTGTGWTVNPDNAEQAIYNGTVELVICAEEVTPVAPTVTGNVCVGGEYTEPGLQLAETGGVTYAVVQQIDENGDYVVSATLGDGYTWGEMPEGWTADGRTATYNGKVDLNPCVDIVPVTPTVNGNVCDGGLYTPATIVTGNTDGITYEVTQDIDADGNFVVTATLGGTLAWGEMPNDNWTITSPTTATYNGHVDLKPCAPAIPATPAVVQAVCTGGALVPPTVTPATTEGIIYELEGGIAPGATVIVTATLVDGYAWPAEMPDGWTATSTTTATTTLTLDDVECAEIIPAAPLVSNAVCDDGGITTPQVTLQETDGIDYTLDGTIAPGATVTVTATLVDGKAWGEMPDGWTRVSETTATYEIVLEDPECAPAIPVAPIVNQAVCIGGGLVPPTVTTVDSNGIDYTFNEADVVNGGTIVVTATIQTGYAWGAMPEGWTKVDATTAIFTVELPEVECEIVVPVTPAITDPECVDGIPADPSVDTPETPGVVYTKDGNEVPGGTVVVTATLQDGYAWGEMPEGWVQVNDTTATFTTTFGTPVCEIPADPQDPADPETPAAKQDAPVTALPVTGSGPQGAMSMQIGMMLLASGLLGIASLGIRRHIRA